VILIRRVNGCKCDTSFSWLGYAFRDNIAPPIEVVTYKTVGVWINTRALRTLRTLMHAKNSSKRMRLWVQSSGNWHRLEVRCHLRAFSVGRRCQRRIWQITRQGRWYWLILARFSCRVILRWRWFWSISLPDDPTWPVHADLLVQPCYYLSSFQRKHRVARKKKMPVNLYLVHKRYLLVIFELFRVFFDDSCCSS
jgi:hypothetical protein